MGEPVPTPDVIRKLIGPPLRLGFAQLLRDPSPANVETAVATYRERFAEKGIFEAQLTSGVPETLEALRSGGWQLYVVTSKMQNFAEQTLDHFGIAHHFDGVFGGSLSNALDDKAEIVKNCVTTSGISTDESIMVGDRLHDFHAARAHGIGMIGVRCGFAEPGELEGLGCLRIVNDVSELLSLT